MKKLALCLLVLGSLAAGCDSQPAATETTPTKQYETKQSPSTQIPVPIKQKSSSNCDPNYSGCVPIASDVDCAGGSGNGPAYVRGPVNVIGSDVYDLDRDHDGLACE